MGKYELYFKFIKSKISKNVNLTLNLCLETIAHMKYVHTSLIAVLFCLFYSLKYYSFINSSWSFLWFLVKFILGTQSLNLFRNTCEVSYFKLSSCKYSGFTMVDQTNSRSCYGLSFVYLLAIERVSLQVEHP